MSAPDGVVNALSVDVEDWFQVSAFEKVLPRSGWDALELRVAQNVERLLDLFARRGVKATWFALGWVAERAPEVIARIHAAGQEVASHGYQHERVSSLTEEAFRADLERAERALTAAAPVTLHAYRAPSFSFTRETAWAWRVLAERGYEVSSSVFPVKHDHYGIPDFPRGPVDVEVGGRTVRELPMTTWRVLGRNVPASGGGWMRVLPPAVVRHAISKVNADGLPAVLYLHPWEVDPEQPRVSAAPWKSRFRHYVNLAKTLPRLDALLERFRWGTVREALAAVPPERVAPAPDWTRS
jgi:polysaccharide deacetylase family protein (PEP-CTERM system associated)